MKGRKIVLKRNRVIPPTEYTVCWTTIPVNMRTCLSVPTIISSDDGSHTAWVHARREPFCDASNARSAPCFCRSAYAYLCFVVGGGSEGDRGQAAISKFPNQNNLVLKQQFRRSSGPHTALPAFELSPLVSSWVKSTYLCLIDNESVPWNKFMRQWLVKFSEPLLASYRRVDKCQRNPSRPLTVETDHADVLLVSQ
jgi:hypothetical protein